MKKLLSLIILKPFKRMAGFILFIFLVLVFGTTVFPFLFVFFGIDKANHFMDNNTLPLVEWWN